MGERGGVRRLGAGWLGGVVRETRRWGGDVWAGPGEEDRVGPLRE